MNQKPRNRQRRFFRLIIFLLISNLCISSFSLAAVAAPGDDGVTRDFVLDDDKAVYTGSWLNNTGDSPVERLGASFRHVSSAGANATATYTVQVEADGWYQVYGWWCAESNRATNAPYTVSCNTQNAVIAVNQRANGGQWNRLYAVKASVGDSISVVITSSSAVDGYVISDGVRISLENEIILEEANAVLQGSWTRNTTDSIGERFGSSFHHSSGAYGGATPNATATYTTTAPMSGIYKVYGWWTANANRASDAPYTITTGDGSSQTVRVNQRANGGKWNMLGKVRLLAGQTITTVIGNNANGYTVANGVKVQLDDYIIDDDEAVYTGKWVTVPFDLPEQRYGREFRYASTYVGDGASPTATAEYTAQIIEDGKYNIYAWWTPLSNRATNAPYTLTCDGVSETIRVNQREDGGKWNLLGDFDAAAGDVITVTLGNNANGYVIADAVKIEPEGSVIELQFTLRALIERAEKERLSALYVGAVPSAKRQFDKALADAKALLDNPNADENDYSEAITSLENAFELIKKQAAKKERLAEAIAYAEAISASNYKTEGRAAFETALESAKSVYNDEDAIQSEVDSAIKLLISALLRLRLIAV